MKVFLKSEVVLIWFNFSYYGIEILCKYSNLKTIINSTRKKDLSISQFQHTSFIKSSFATLLGNIDWGYFVQCSGAILSQNTKTSIM